jgi:hypothetical protein
MKIRPSCSKRTDGHDAIVLFARLRTRLKTKYTSNTCGLTRPYCIQLDRSGFIRNIAGARIHT